MFSGLLQEHQRKVAEYRAKVDKHRSEATQHANKLSDALVDTVNSGVAEAFQTQKVVEQEARSLQSQANKFSKQTQQWIAAITTFDNALKELGDFENYVRTLEWEIQTVSDALERVSTEDR
ncbi:GCN5-like protein [Chloropicon primus]|uniref:Biogenesis of lysosome-related organelles complex 1 subunit 1 n=1 Tax=Chloropicon primus TaxID=1764295 RepID=A0A5B8MZA9_9CHLO|nr:GCN5-like protein [Chloropicon primus]UPR04594.1 GCN5-like protein [Chloropicon primus]|mmetsp:Transcript_8378/g.23951  ORF Transcript_8378/g.23951 Transcript_8378/m.23951 type:complete len:121 (+) Transcript_8378:206-568(+)|eukprot:QDZ25396.1 GCN5-like protein [Chloropicon primus]